MYKYYINNVIKKFTIANSELHHVISIIHSTYLVLYRNRQYIKPKVYDKIMYDIKNYNNKNRNSELGLSVYDVREESFTDYNTILRNVIQQFNYNANRKYNKVKEQVDKYIKLTIVSEEEYYRIVKTYNDIIAEELVKTGLAPLPRRMGNLNIILFQNNNPNIDWNKSNKFKQNLIDEGIKVRKGDNGGESWLIRNEDEYRYKICLDKGYNLAKDKYHLYVFVPTNYTNGKFRNYDFLKDMNINMCFDSRFGLVQKVRNYRVIDPTIDVIYSYFGKNKI